MLLLEVELEQRPNRFAIGFIYFPLQTQYYYMRKLNPFWGKQYESTRFIEALLKLKMKYVSSLSVNWGGFNEFLCQVYQTKSLIGMNFGSTWTWSSDKWSKFNHTDQNRQLFKCTIMKQTVQKVIMDQYLRPQVTRPKDPLAGQANLGSWFHIFVVVPDSLWGYPSQPWSCFHIFGPGHWLSGL